MSTFLAIGSFILRLVFGIICVLACGYYVYVGIQLLSWRHKDAMDIIYGIFSVFVAVVFVTIGLLLIVSLFF